MVSGVVNFNHSTIAGNTADSDSNASGDGGGIYRSAGTVNLKNSIVADNIDRGNQAPDCFGVMTTQLDNHIENVTGCTFNTSTGDITGSDPGLGRSYPITVDRLRPSSAVNSVVLDTIPNGRNDCGRTITNDQRGATRATDSDANSTVADKAAVELGKLFCGIQKPWNRLPMISSAGLTC